jgi:hypothetical protein
MLGVANGGSNGIERAASGCGILRLRSRDVSSGSVGFNINDTPADLEADAGEKLPAPRTGARGRGGNSIVRPTPGTCGVGDGAPTSKAQTG